MGRTRWLKTAAITTVIAVPALLFGRSFFLVPLQGYENASIVERLSRSKFETTAWKRGDVGDDPIRIKMVDDLLHRYKLIGMTKGEIDTLLGVPPKTNYFHEYDYVYWLGPERSSISIDSEWLVIKFDNGRVAKAKVVRD